MSGFSGVADAAAWTAYTPTITSQSGAPTTVTATGRYKQIGKTIFLNVSVTITTKNTAAGNLIASLPFAASAAAVFSGSSFESLVTAKSGGAAILAGASTVFCRDAAAATYWVDGYLVAISIIYEIP